MTATLRALWWLRWSGKHRPISLSPTTAVHGTAGFTLTVSGKNFKTGAVVYFDGVPMTTTFVSSTSLTALVPIGSIATARTVTVYVLALDGGLGRTTIFTIT